MNSKFIPFTYLKILPYLADYGFGQYRYAVVVYFHYATVYHNHLFSLGTTRRSFKHNISSVQRTDERRVIVQDLERTDAAGKLRRNDFAGKNFLVRGNDF